MRDVIAGVILIGLGLLRLGALIKFIPYPVITGFTAGIAVIIFSSQVKDLLGLKVAKVPPAFMDKWVAYADNFRTADLTTIAIAAGSLAVLIIWPRFVRIVPAPFVAMVLARVRCNSFTCRWTRSQRGSSACLRRCRGLTGR